MSPRIALLYRLHDEFNEEFFGNKLLHLNILLETRNKHKLGVYEYHGGKNADPNPTRLEDAVIIIHQGNFSCEDLLWGTLLHEMIHQYQAEVLNLPAIHDSIFKSIARQAEKRYGIGVR